MHNRVDRDPVSGHYAPHAALHRAHLDTNAWTAPKIVGWLKGYHENNDLQGAQELSRQLQQVHAGQGGMGLGNKLQGNEPRTCFARYIASLLPPTVKVLSVYT